MLTIQGLTCRYGSLVAVDDLSGTFAPGQITALLGPNGSGKSTLLRCIAGIVPLASGSITWSDQSLPSMEPRHRAKIVSYVPQEEVPEFEFSAQEIVLMGRHGATVGMWESDSEIGIAMSALKRCDVHHVADRAVTQLSGGERQRVWIARGLAQGAPVLLLDEPIAHLDPAHQVSLRSILRDEAERGVCVIVAVHDVNWAHASTDRTMMLSNGAVAADIDTKMLPSSDVLGRIYGVEFRAPDSTDAVLVPAALSVKTESRT